MDAVIGALRRDQTVLLLPSSSQSCGFDTHGGKMTRCGQIGRWVVTSPHLTPVAQHTSHYTNQTPNPPPHTDRPFWNSYPAINRSQKKRQVTDISRSKVVIVEQTLHNLIVRVIGAFPQSGTSLFPQDGSDTKFDFLLFWRLVFNISF